MHKKIIYTLLIFTFSFLLSSEEPKCQIYSCDKIEKMGVLPSGRKCIGYFCESRNSGFISNLDFIYFQPKEDCFEFASKNSNIDHSSGSSLIDLWAKTYSFDFSYTPGFKLGMGFFIPHISWEVFFNWTQLYSKIKNKECGKGGGLIPLFWNPAAFDNIQSTIRFSKSNAKLDFFFDSLDFEMGDTFFTSPYLILKVYGGLKGAVIHQRFYVKYKDGNTITDKNSKNIDILTGSTKIRSNSKGIGPRIGIDSSWNICRSDFNIVANGSFALLLTRFNVRHHEFDTAYDTIADQTVVNEYKIHEYVWLVRPNAHLKLGINWGKCLGNCKNYYLGFTAAYEIQYFWEQNLSRRFVDEQNLGLTYPNKGDLYLHGLSLSAHFEF